MCDNCTILEKRIAQLEQFIRQPFASAAEEADYKTFYCDGYNCDKKAICRKYSPKPVNKAAYWARKPVDGDCNHFEPIL